jgi:hypothetical protein
MMILPHGRWSTAAGVRRSVGRGAVIRKFREIQNLLSWAEVGRFDFLGCVANVARRLLNRVLCTSLFFLIDLADLLGLAVDLFLPFLRNTFHVLT